MEAAFAGVGLLIAFGVFLFWLVVRALLLHVAAKLVSVPKAGFLKAVLVTLLGDLVASLISALFSLIPLVGVVLAPLFYILGLLWFTKAIYATGWGKALLIQLLSWVISVLVVAGLVLILAVVMGISLAGLGAA